MGKFGWSLPPGCSMRDIEAAMEEGPCVVCGNAIDNCTCEPCPTCGNAGCIEHQSINWLTTQIEIRSFQLRELQAEYQRRQQELSVKCPKCGKEKLPDLMDGTAYCRTCDVAFFKQKDGSVRLLEHDDY